MVHKIHKTKTQDHLGTHQANGRVTGISEQSKDLIADMDNTEIFELCEKSSKQQCPECNNSWETGIIYCSCGRNMKSSQRPTEFEQNNFDVTSIPGYVIKKNSSRGAKTRTFCTTKNVLPVKKAREKKHGRYPTILARACGKSISRVVPRVLSWPYRGPCYGWSIAVVAL